MRQLATTIVTADQAETEPAGHSAPRRFGPPSREVQSFLELFAIAGLAVTQPVLDLLSKNVSIFVTRRASAFQVLLLAVVIAVVPAAVAWTLEVVVGAAVPRLRRWLHALLIAGFAGLVVEQATKKGTDFGPAALVVVGLLGAMVAAVLVLRSSSSRMFLRYLAVAPVLFLALFVFAAPVAAVISGDQAESVAGTSIKNPKRVVMIVMDELPLESLLDGTGKIDAELYPNFAALAGTSTWYRNDTSVAPFTEQAVPALLTGNYPSDPGTVPIASEYPDSIFRLLGGAYRMNVHESITHLCAGAVCPQTGNAEGAGLLRSMKRLLVDTGELWSDFASPERRQRAAFSPPDSLPPQTAQARQFVASLQPSDVPTFDFLHVLLPHQPWRYLPTLQEVGYTPNDPADLANLLKWQSDWSAALGRERHILQTMAADTVLGQVVTRLKNLGAWDDSVFVLTADHGEGFTTDKPLRTATEETANEILWTPLFIKAPEQDAPVVDDRPMQSVDIVPTIAAMLEAKIPWPVDGVSALNPPRDEFPRRFYQWQSTFSGKNQPDDVPVAETGKYLTFDANRYFPEVLAARAAAPVGDPGLRPYRIGDYPQLIGEDAAPLVRPEPGGPTNVNLKASANFANVNPQAAVVPWTWLEGYVVDLDQDVTLAFSVNGKIAGFGRATVVGGGPNGFYWASIAPQFFRAGANDVVAYVVSGPPDRPSLSPVPLGG